MATGQADLHRDVWHREVVWPAGATGPVRARLREDDLQQRRAMPGEQYVAQVIAWLFEDAQWYYETEGRWPDGLATYEHEPHYLELFRLVLATVSTANAPKPPPSHGDS